MFQVRRGVFETNSSSVHSLTMCTAEEYQKWENGEILFWRYEDRFCTREEAIEALKSKSWFSGIDWNNENEVSGVFSDETIQTCGEFFDNCDYETFEQSFTTPSGDEVVAFGYYGHD